MGLSQEVLYVAILQESWDGWGFSYERREGLDDDWCSIEKIIFSSRFQGVLDLGLDAAFLYFGFTRRYYSRIRGPPSSHSSATTSISACLSWKLAIQARLRMEVETATCFPCRYTYIQYVVVLNLVEERRPQ